MSNKSMGFREIEHTADWELEVWAANILDLFVQAAQGMYQLCGARIAQMPRQIKLLDLQSTDWESLLVLFLSELLYIAESEKLAFNKFDLSLDNFTLHGQLEGGALLGLEKEIKAVTFHNLNIQGTHHGLQVRIVFDV